MKKDLGYTKPLFILPFDHRGSYSKKVFGIEGRAPTPEEMEEMKVLKYVIYQAFEKAVSEGRPPKDGAAILVDEEYGEAVLNDARAKGYTVCLPVEKSGQDILELEFGDKFGEHIQKFKPTIVKVLVRYNPGDNKELNQKQLQVLKQVSDFCLPAPTLRREPAGMQVPGAGYKMLIEPLIPATNEQLAQVGEDGSRYDNEIRPGLTVQMIKEFQDGGIENDIWKLEGMEKTSDYEAVSSQARAGGRDNVGVIILGRGSDDEQVTKWLNAGAGVSGIIGFAVGRTIWLDSIKDLRQGKISREDAISQIAAKYQSFYDIFVKAR